MPELTLENAKKDLQGLVEQGKAEVQAKKEESMTPEQKTRVEAERAKAQEAKAQAEAKVKQDAEILAKKEEERTAEEKERANALLEEKRKKDEAAETAEQKIKRVQEQSQRRIDEISNELKQVVDKSSKEAQDLRKELQILKADNENLVKKISQPAATDDTETILARKEAERIKKYLEEDKSKPRELRREMTQDELDEWSLENLTAAQRWISRNTLRQERERQADIENLNREKWVKNMLAKREESAERVKIRHPELNEAVAEADNLKAQGKSKEEIRAIIGAKNRKFKIMAEILDDTSEEFMYQENAPELLAKEMERRLAAEGMQAQSAEQKEIAELRRRLEEMEAKNAADASSDTGINSISQRSKAVQGKLTTEEQVLVDTMKSLNAPEERIQSALAKLRASKGK